jgi:hypothetical protein
MCSLVHFKEQFVSFPTIAGANLMFAVNTRVRRGLGFAPNTNHQQCDFRYSLISKPFLQVRSSIL